MGYEVGGRMKRLDFALDQHCEPLPIMEPNSTGDYVEYEEAMEEIERLTAEVEPLREALADMLAGWRYIRQNHGDLYGVGWDRAQQKAEAALKALEGK